MASSDVFAAEAHASKLDLRTVAILSAIVWLAHLSVIIASSLPLGSVASLHYQTARVGIATAGFALAMLIHVLSPRGQTGAYGKHFLRVLALCLPAALLLTIFGHYQFQWVSPPESYVKPLWDDVAHNIAYYLWIFVSWAALYVGIHAMRESQTHARQLAEIEARAHLSQLTALRYQLNPHFFFNVLNTLSGLVGARRLAEAEQVIIRMADFLRYSLRGGPAELVTLEEELAAQRAYLEIEKIRFGDRLDVRFDVPPACASASTPALILQPLVENAVKHAVARSEAAVTLLIGACCEDGVLTCWVENSAIAGAPDGLPAGLGLGLRNVGARLEAIFGDAASLEAGRTPQGGWRALVRFPLRTQP